MNRSILIVDDDPSVRASLSRVLEDLASMVSTADSGETALSRSDAPADLVLADLRMPGMDGVELLRALRKRDPSIDVIIMTAHDDLPTVATAMREGARDFLIKPFDFHQLRRLVERVLEDRDARKDRAASGGRSTCTVTSSPRGVVI